MEIRTEGRHYIVEQGDCIESIAFQRGLLWKTIWNHPENAALRKARQNWNALLPGDRLFLPNLRLKQVPAATEQRHRFQRKAVPARLSITLSDADDKPVAGEPYLLEVDGTVFSGKTDATGTLEHPISPGAKSGKLTVGANRRAAFSLDLGHIDPITEISGVQGRLANLGFDCARLDGVLDEQTRAAIRAFQHKHGLPETGEIDPTTRGKLEEVYESQGPARVFP